MMNRNLRTSFQHSYNGTVFLFALLLLATALTPLRADVIESVLADPSLSGAPGSTLMFLVTLTNPSATDTIFLNGIGSTASTSFLTVDTSPFDFNAPLFLTPGEVSGPFELFDVTIDPSTSPGPYVGSFVSIQGGEDGGQGTAFDDLADIQFDVDVTGPAAVPEPGLAGLLLAGLVAICARAKRQRRA